MLGGECAEGVHVGNEAEEVYRHQGLRLWRDRSRRRRWIHQPGDRVNVDKSWRGACAQDRGCGGTKRVTNGDDLVAWLDAESFNDCLFGERAVRHGDRMFYTNHLGEAALELGDARTLGKGTRHDRVGGGIGLLATDGGAGDRNANLRRTHAEERISGRSDARSGRLGSPRQHPLWGAGGIPARQLRLHPSRPRPLQGRQQRDPHQHQ